MFTEEISLENFRFLLWLLKFSFQKICFFLNKRNKQDKDSINAIIDASRVPFNNLGLVGTGESIVYLQFTLDV